MSHPPLTRRTLLHRSGLVLATGSIAGCLGNSVGGGEPSTTIVEMTDELVFEPETVRVSTGDTVRWRNVGDVEHTVTAAGETLPKGTTYFASGGFESERMAQTNLNDGLVAPGERYEHTFDDPGTYTYYCIPHESAEMAGTVRVE